MTDRFSEIGEVILASGVTFAVVLVLLNGIGFGAAGVGASLSHPSLPAGSPDSRQPEISVSRVSSSTSFNSRFADPEKAVLRQLFNRRSTEA